MSLRRRFRSPLPLRSRPLHHQQPTLHGSPSHLHSNRCVLLMTACSLALIFFFKPECRRRPRLAGADTGHTETAGSGEHIDVITYFIYPFSHSLLVRKDHTPRARHHHLPLPPQPSRRPRLLRPEPRRLSSTRQRATSWLHTSTSKQLFSRRPRRNTTVCKRCILFSESHHVSHRGGRPADIKRRRAEPACSRCMRLTSMFFIPHASVAGRRARSSGVDAKDRARSNRL